MMQEKSASKMLWHQALAGGLVLGSVLFAWDFVCYAAKVQSFVAQLLQVLIVAAGIVFYGNKLKTLRGVELGFSYGACFGFVMALMLCTGAVYGVGQFFLQVVIAPEYYAEAYEVTVLNAGLDGEMAEQMIALRASALFRNPLMFIISGIFSMIFMGGFIGLILSAFLQKAADPFAGRGNDYDPGA